MSPASAEVIPNDTKPLRLWVTWVLALMAVAFAAIPVATRSPDLERLSREPAVRVSTDWLSTFNSRLNFRAESGKTVGLTCGGKGSRCNAFDAKTEPREGEQVWVWHDGKDVYQLHVGERVLLPYASHRRGWDMLMLFAVLCAFAALIRAGIHLGLIQGIHRGPIQAADGPAGPRP